MTTATLPATINPARARLPQTYEAARQALTECSSIDECKDWSDKAEALASYARQSNDDTLHKMADRIQARAIRRVGELLKPFQADPKSSLRNGSRGGGAPPTGSQRQAAKSAGLSKDQEKQARRVANVPEPDFEAAVESETPPTVTELAERGRKRTSITPHPRPKNFYAATHTIAAMRTFSEFCAKYPAEDVADGLTKKEAGEVRALVRKIEGWLDRFVVTLETQ